MADKPNLFWVNKTLDSPSLSNCRHEKPINAQIRSHIRTAAHKRSRVERQIKRTLLGLSWVRRTTNRNYADTSDLLPPVSRKKCDAGNLFIEHTVKSDAPLRKQKGQLAGQRLSVRLQSPRESDSDAAQRANSIDTSMFHCLNGIADPFSSWSVKLDATALDHIYYFANTWTQCAFKIPGCIGYGQAPIELHEIKAVVQQCLNSAIHCYCLLAAASARMRYIQHTEGQAGDYALAHSYARRALRELSTQIQAHMQTKSANNISESLAANIVLLTAYEVFCSNEEAGQIHLTAVRRLYRMAFSNTFMSRLQANLEILCSKA